MFKRDCQEMAPKQSQSGRGAKRPRTSGGTSLPDSQNSGTPLVPPLVTTESEMDFDEVPRGRVEDLGLSTLPFSSGTPGQFSGTPSGTPGQFSGTPEENPGTPEEVDEDEEAPEKVLLGTSKAMTQTWHLLFRLGTNQKFTEKHGFERHIYLTEAGDKKWADSRQHCRTYTVGSKFGGNVEGDIPLFYDLPSNTANLSPDDFITGYDKVCQIKNWLQEFLSGPHAVRYQKDGNTKKGTQKEEVTELVPKIVNYMLAPQMDDDGRGAHFHLVCRGRMFSCKAAAVAYNNLVWTSAWQQLFGQPAETCPPPCGFTDSMHCREWQQRSGYVCHSHSNPWLVQQKGTYTRENQQAWYQKFQLWQDLKHVKHHIRETEASSNITATGRNDVEPTDHELCLRNIEDMIASGHVAVHGDRLTESRIGIGRLLLRLNKPMADWFRQNSVKVWPQMSDAILMRNEPSEDRPPSYDLSSFNNVPAILDEWYNENVVGDAKRRYLAFVLFDQTGSKGKTEWALAQKEKCMYFKGNISWSQWNPRRAGSRFVVLDDVELFGQGTNIKGNETLKAILQGGQSFDVVSEKGAYDNHCVHGLPVIIFTNDAGTYVRLTQCDDWFSHNTVGCELKEKMFG